MGVESNRLVALPRHVSRHLFFRLPSDLSRFLETCQQFDIAWRVAIISVGSAGCPVRLGKLRPLGLKLLKCLLLVTDTFLQRLLFSEARRSGIVEAAAPRNIKSWHVISHHGDQMRPQDDY